MAHVPPELYAHREWLGQLQQVGLVVSPQVLVDNGVFVDRQRSVDAQVRLRALLPDGDDTGEVSGKAVDFVALTRDVLEWSDDLLAGAPGGSPLPEALTVALPEHNDTLSPSYAIPEPGKPGEWMGLVSLVATGTNFDKAPEDHGGWRAAPHARLERLLRETGIPIGLLFSGTEIRLVHAPRGESSGHLTFRFAHLAETLGRPMMGALCALLGVERVTDASLEQQRLPHLLKESRKYQNKVSTELAGQVLEALWELLRGLQRANEESKGALLADVLRERPGDVYGGLLTTMMRLVFILYAEDRGLMPAGDVYQRHYSVSGLFERLREDQARYPDTMDARFGAWAQLLVLFRLIHDGGGHGDLQFPPRHGRLFDPDVYPFLEGRLHDSHRQLGESIEPAKIPDGVVFRVLDNLLMLDGERLSYRTLDVEQIGSVYEAMMGFALQVATGPSIAVAPKHIVVNLEDLLEQKPKDRAAWLKEHAELKLTSDLLPKAATPPDAVGALGKRVSRYTPHVLKVGDLFLQPTEERRRSGSHYTPRSLTEPIVATTFRPIFERLGDQATPEQILDLKVCDPAMGSGAFLVEACRLLAERLVRAWEVHKSTPKVPDDEDVLTFARRLVAERCLYGVDKNIFAVDLAKLSLWLATLARDHPFTFLDHSLRHGDSLVGLSREQIASLHWEPQEQQPLIRTFVGARIAEAQALRVQLQAMGASDDVAEKTRLLREADEALDGVRLMADVVVSAFFERDKVTARERLRTAYAGRIEHWLPSDRRRNDVTLDLELRAVSQSLRGGNRPVPAFHWEIEFPEVFARPDGGFDVLIGNPPFAGKNTIGPAHRAGYLSWLTDIHEQSHGNADLVAHFYRRAFNVLRPNGAFGLIATNTIAQGDTRSTGLRWIRQHGGTIFEARKRVRWPGAAAVIVSVVHVSKGRVPGPYVLDGRHLDLISAFLFHTGGDTDPVALKANDSLSFQGAIVLGMGFTFDDTDQSGVANSISLMRRLIDKDARNAERIFPYIGGEELNESPTHAHHRFVINFEDMTEDEARRWPDLMQIVESKVKPNRLRDNRESYRRHWWQFAERRGELFQVLRTLKRVLVHSFASKYLQFAFVPANVIVAGPAPLFIFEEESAFGVLQSRAHEVWAVRFSSTLEDRLKYSPSDCFVTFPFPLEWNANINLDAASRRYYELRAALMVRNNEGLTSTYNRFHNPEECDPDILKLRELHDAMDRAVLDAYGWTDIQPRCEFILDYEDDEDETPGRVSRRRKPWRYRWPDEIRDEVLGRLLELNAERAREEHLSAGKSAKPPRGGPKVKKRRLSSGGGLLDRL
jgi:hypothetical protein